MPELVAKEHRIAFSQGEIGGLAKKLIKMGERQSVWILRGPMGVGKTTLVKALVAERGIVENVTSPTFSIVNEYQDMNGQPIYHFDFYRIKNEAEAFDIGTEEYFDSGNWCLVEWPEKIPSLLTMNYFELQLDIIDEQTRLIRYGNHA